MIEKKSVRSELILDKEPLKLENQKKYVISLFDNQGKLLFKDLVKNLASRFEIILTFLAILDLIKSKACIVVQNTVYGEIELSLTKIKIMSLKEDQRIVEAILFSVQKPVDQTIIDKVFINKQVNLPIL